MCAQTTGAFPIKASTTPLVAPPIQRTGSQRPPICGASRVLPSLIKTHATTPSRKMGRPVAGRRRVVACLPDARTTTITLRAQTRPRAVRGAAIHVHPNTQLNHRSALLSKTTSKTVRSRPVTWTGLVAGPQRTAIKARVRAHKSALLTCQRATRPTTTMTKCSNAFTT